MKKGWIWVVIVVVVIIAGAAYWYSTRKSGEYAATPAEQSAGLSTSTASSSSLTSSTSNSESSTGTQNPPAAAPAPQSFTVHGNDSSADLETITVPKGTVVSITFGADAQGTYHGGLDFRSTVVSTGPIAPGSTKTVNFTATKSFAFTPYWPSTNIAKPYTISIVVE